MAASASDLFTKTGFGTATTLASPGYTAAVSTSINVTSTSAMPTDTGVIFTIDEVDSDGVRVSGTYNVFEGTVNTATQITNVDYIGGDTERSYSAGATVRVYIGVSSYMWNRLVTGLMAEHDHLDGTHTAITPTSIAVSGTSTLTGALTIKSYDGWINTADTWTYASSTSFTISGVDRTAQFPAGTKLYMDQSGDKYFYVTSSSFSTNTTVNVYGGTDYTVANAAISSPALSYDANPQGFPNEFAYTPTLTNMAIGTGGTPENAAWFTIKEGWAEGFVSIEFGSSSNTFSGDGQFSLPVAASADLTGSNAAGKMPIGEFIYSNPGGSDYPGLVHYAATTKGHLKFHVDDSGAGAAYSALGGGGSGAPASTMGDAGHLIGIKFRYKVA